MTPADTSLMAAARTAGIGYAAIFVLALFANFAVRMRLVVPDDAAATAGNLAGSEGLFRAGIAAFVVVFVLDIAVAWGLYVVLRPAGRQRSLLAAWFRLTYTAFLGVAVVFLVLALDLATAAGPVGALGALGTPEREAGVALAVKAFDITWLIGLAAFGVHLVLVGRMIVTSRVAPRPLGLVLVAAGAAYVVDTFAHLVLEDYAAYANAFLVGVAVPSVVGELGLTVWLLARAGRTAGADPGEGHLPPAGGADTLRPARAS